VSDPGTREWAATWHDVECGAYTADLATWDELAATASGPVLELGCGTGRVAIRLARAGHEVTAIDSSAPLVAALRERVAAAGVEIETAVADARELALDARFALVCAPMQLIQLMGGAPGRERMLRRALAHLAPRGALAVAILAADFPVDEGGPAPLPDVLERDGYVFSSLPVEVRAVNGGLEVRRLRQLVFPSGELRDEVDITRLDSLSAPQLEAEAEAVGLEARERIAVPPTPDHVGSTIVVMEAP
jgi:SAM-dependent methyltransferase